MKVCIPADGTDLAAKVDARLGRAEHFVVVDSESGEVLQTIPNKQNKQASAGAGVQAGQTIAGAGADAVLCAHCGPKAFRVLQAAGLKVYTGAAGAVGDALRAFRNGELTEAQGADIEGHW
ncbi:MAG TPA: NifB/NifX family molybdenum-iron cluster-binding protein [Phycisphaerae bacterium]|nr:NifB/NifX family molybdenum-iron cluster-binding protein [Phycisphaerae bacterium]